MRRVHQLATTGLAFRHSSRRRPRFNHNLPPAPPTKRTPPQVRSSHFRGSGAGGHHVVRDAAESTREEIEHGITQFADSCASCWICSHPTSRHFPPLPAQPVVAVEPAAGPAPWPVLPDTYCPTRAARRESSLDATSSPTRHNQTRFPSPAQPPATGTRPAPPTTSTSHGHRHLPPAALNTLPHTHEKRRAPGTPVTQTDEPGTLPT